MSETLKLRSFCSEPMGEKLVLQVPGVGIIAARKLRTINYIKARDLYNRLKKLDFDAKKFRVWVTLNCKGAKVSTIYKALMGYHAQFGDTETEDLESPRRESPPTPRLVATRGGRILPAARREKPRNSVKFNLCSSERENQPSVSESPRSSLLNDVDPLTLFFTSFSDSCKSISPEFHTDLKMDILGIVRDYERKSRAKRSESTPTSSAANGF